MADSIREQILALVESRLETISNAASVYETNLGQNVFVGRDLDSAPFQSTELPGVNIVDLREEHQPQISSRTDHHHTLYLEFQFAARATAAGGKTDALKQARKCLSDIIKAIGTTTNGKPGYRWANASGTELAFNTLPMDNELGLDQREKALGIGIYRVKIEYRTQRWNPYDQ